ncbi:MAG: hypothetical protein LKH33_11815 [Acetobacter sp.]|jgi:hypothetical protein|nr:hypothetical protein [Acetobacter sp.]MCH4060021.1 hypothetical protein [Acetobacter sp.]MCH4086961.1 hypothetical protein [Acetobacter sp.]MCI1295013.1 hypothetical protein [Acetobacter sp.]MCI1321571.1 hypothetical protein [Acetobacter sp.]
MSVMHDQFASNVVPFRLSVLPRHKEYLGKWLDAGLPMGICDADICQEMFSETQHSDQVMIWVRETSAPAYTIHPEGTKWIVVDAIRGRELTRQASFEDALHFVRPVLPRHSKIAAA